MKLRLIIVTALLSLQAGQVMSGEKIGRYTSMTPGPAPYQINLLKSSVNVAFPREVVLVGDALRVLLGESGYRLAIEQDPDIAILFNQLIPAVHRQLGPMQLIEAIEVLAGEQWLIEVNPVARTLTFQLRDEYRHFAGELLVHECSSYKVDSLLPIYFAPNSIALSDQAKQVVKLLASDLMNNPSYRVRIKGYSDPLGSDDARLLVSKNRALNVSNHLSKLGLASQVLSAQGLGYVEERAGELYAMQRVVKIEVLSCSDTQKE